MREDSREVVSRRALLEWVLHIIDVRIKEGESLLQQYGDNEDEAVYFESRLRRDRAAKAIIAEDLEKCEDDDD